MKAHLKINTQFKKTLILSYDQLEGKVIPLTQLSFITRMMTQYRLLFSYRAFNAQTTLLRYRYAMGNVCVLPIIDAAMCEHVKKVFEKDNMALSLYLNEDILWHVVQKNQQIKEDWQIFLVTSFDNGYSINAFYKGFLVFKRTLKRNDDTVAMEKLETETLLHHEKIYDEVISSVRYLKRIAPMPLNTHFCMMSFAMETQDIHKDQDLFRYFVKQFQRNIDVESQGRNAFKLNWTTQYIHASEKDYLYKGLNEKSCARILLPWALWPVILFKKGGQCLKYAVLPFLIMTALVWVGVGGVNAFYSRDNLEKERITYQKRASDFYVLEGLYHQTQQPFFEDFLKDLEKMMHFNKGLSLVGIERKHDHERDKSLTKRDRVKKRNPFVNILFQEKLPPHFIQDIQKKYPKYFFHQEFQSPHTHVLRVDIKR